MDKLPIEILVNIFQYLNKEEQIKFSIINKKFREALFSPSLWTEYEKIMEVPASKMTSFRKFLKQTPWLKYLNLLVSESAELPSTVNLRSVFKPLNNLECLSLQFNRCVPIKIFFPSTLKHISLVDCRFIESESFITDNILIKIADSCPLLEHIQIKSLNVVPSFYTSRGLTYLLKKFKETLKTFVLFVPHRDRLFSFFDCPANLKTLFLRVNFTNDFADEDHLNLEKLKLPNLENLQILSIVDDFVLNSHPPAFPKMFLNCLLKNLRSLHIDRFNPFLNEDFYTKFSKLPNLEVLYLDSFCDVFIDDLVKFIRNCSSLKVLVWIRFPAAYPKKDMLKLEKLKKERPLKIYIYFREEVTHWEEIYCPPTFPNENFDCIEAFNHLFKEIFHDKLTNFFNCHAPIFKKSMSY